MSKAVGSTDTGQSPGTPSWHRLPHETADAYSRFRYFISLGAGRTIKQVSRDLHVNYQSVIDMSKKYNWLARAMEFEQAALDTILTRSSEPAMKKQQDIVVNDALESYKKLVLLWDNVIGNVDPTTVDAYTLSSLVNARDKIDAMGRRATRLPSTYKQIDEPKETSENDNQPVQLVFDDAPTMLILEAENDSGGSGN